jgi:predicted acyltransferase
MKEQVSELRERVVSIDALRGLAMFLILATQIGGAPIFKTFCDMIWNENWPAFVTSQMTWVNQRVSFMNIAQSIFIFIVGVVIPYSIRNRQSRMNDTKIILSIIKRALILYLFGLIAGGKLLILPESGKTFANFPVYNNVLEYISISYLVCSILVLKINVKVQYIVTGALLLLFWAIWLFIPAPGGNGDIYSKEMNIGQYIDKLVLGAHASQYGTKVLNTINNISITMIGVLAGHLIFSKRSQTEKVRRLFIAGFAMIIAGKIWSLFFPIIRDFNTSTFVLVSVGVAVILLASFYLIIDIRGHSKWAFFFIVFGVNSIAIYMMAHLFDFRLIGNIVIGGISTLFPQNAANFIQAVTAMVVMWLIVYFLYKKRTFIKI